MTDPYVKQYEGSQSHLNNISPSEGLRLMKAFLTISSRDDRLKVISLAEMLAAGALPYAKNPD